MQAFRAMQHDVIVKWAGLGAVSGDVVGVSGTPHDFFLWLL